MPTKLVVDCSTGAVEEIELTAEEIAEMELAAQQAEEQKAREEEEKAAKEAWKAEDKFKMLLKEFNLLNQD